MQQSTTTDIPFFSRTSSHTPSRKLSLEQGTEDRTIKRIEYSRNPSNSAQHRQSFVRRILQHRNTFSRNLSNIAKYYTIPSPWDEYLDRLEEPLGNFSKTQIIAVRNLWRQIQEIFLSKFPLPQAGPTPNGAVMLVWDKGEHHLEIEIQPDCKFEWFYSNRKTGSFEGKEDVPPNEIPKTLVTHLRKLL